MKIVSNASGGTRRASRWLLAALVAGGCGAEIAYTNDPATSGAQPPEATVMPGGTSPGENSDASDGGTPPTAATGLPCDVAQVFAKLCLSCHSAPPRNAAPMPLVTYEQLTAVSAQYAGQTYAARSLARMKAGTMPPGGGATAADIAALESWVNAGTPKGACDQTPDAGVPLDWVPDSPPTCTSKTYWTRGDSGSSRMHPGLACIACHSTRYDAPSFHVAGTVFPSTHEPDNCNGSSSTAITVEITDARNAVHNLHPNSAGNFYLEWPSIPMPYKARVLANGKVRAMLTPQSSGDCNACHTQSGTQGAPGRIVAP